MIPQFAAGFLALWPLVFVPLLGGSAGSAGPSDPQAGQSGAGVAPSTYQYAFACDEGTTGEKSFSSKEELCAALRSEQVCAVAARVFAALYDCP